MNTLLAALMSGNTAGFTPKYSVAFEIGQNEHMDPDWELVENYQYNTAGFRLGYNVSPKLEMIASYQNQTTSNYSNYYDYSYDEEYTSSAFTGLEAFVEENIISVGPKLNLNLKPWFVPYATGQAVMVHQKLTMHDAYSTSDDAITLIDDSAFGMGLAGALGLELRSRPVAGKAQLNTFFEYGGVTGPKMNFALKEAGADGSDINIGDLQYGGYHFRFGLGARF
jgi:hypothetical protein